MKKYISIIILLLLLDYFLSSCHSIKGARPIKGTEIESFDAFCDSFFSDSLFQINRIKFPLESYIDDLSSIDYDTIRYPNFNKDNWRMLRNNIFKGADSIISDDGNIYRRKISRTDSIVNVSIYIDSSGYFTNVKFVQNKGKWFLTDYLVSND